jgi:hypothetical protein
MKGDNTMRTYHGKAFDSLVNQYRQEILQEKRNGERVKHHWERLNMTEQEYILSMPEHEKEIQAYDKALVDVQYVEIYWPWKIAGIDMIQRINERWDCERSVDPGFIPSHNIYIPESELSIGGYGSPIDWNPVY